ncbi:MAG: AMP-binding protein, partial [Janthinobacterium lividum]
MTPFAEARATLLRHRDDHDAACRDFRWPVLDRFNWALEHFDRLAVGNEAPALRVVGGGHEASLSFAALSRRSNQVANHLRDLGVMRGDRILLLLGNVAPLWEAMLAAMKLGAVVIPAATLLGPDDLRDRIARGRVRHVIADAALVARLDGLADGLTRIAVGGTTPGDGRAAQGDGCAAPGDGCAAPGWRPFEAAYAASAAFVPDGETRADDPLLLYFTSGTTARPKLVLHTHASYPVGHLSTMYWLGVQPGDVHLNLASPGWAKHAWSSVFAPWNAGAT